MVNLNKDTIKKIKDIDQKADAILKNADKTSETLISQARYEAPSLIKTSQEKRDKMKTEKIDSAKKAIEEESQEIISKGQKIVLDKEAKIEKNIDDAAAIAVDMFIKKIKLTQKD